MAERRNDKVQNHPNVKARILHHNDEAEQALLGCLFINEDAPVTVLSEVKPDDFYQPAHRDIFQAMLELYWKDKPIDIATIVQQTEEMGVYESVGGVTYISTLSSFVPSGENYVHYMEIVKKYVELYGAIPEEPFEKQCRAIQNAQDGVEALNQKIKEIKGI